MSILLSILGPLLKVLADAFFGVVLTTPAIEKEVINVETIIEPDVDLSYLDRL